MSQRRILIVTDGRVEQMAGIQLFLNTLRRNSPLTIKDWDIVVIHPSYSKVDHSMLDGAPGLQLCPIDQDRHEDKYYVKLLLKSYVEKHGSPEDLVLYLDYDHIVRSTIHIPPVKDGILYVGSEVKPLSAVVDRDDFGEQDSRLLSNQHYNASFIYATQATFQLAVKDWVTLYENCISRVSRRYVEEISFFLSACTYCSVTPIPLEIQSGWEQNTGHCSLFHYGGENRWAHLFKQLLPELLTTNDQRSQVRQELMFASELLDSMIVMSDID